MASAPHRAKKTKKHRKHGRNGSACTVYKNSHRREQNKVVRLKRHLTRFPGDGTAKASLTACKVILGIR